MDEYRDFKNVEANEKGKLRYNTTPAMKNATYDNEDTINGQKTFKIALG